jgi:hypothetical protein
MPSLAPPYPRLYHRRTSTVAQAVRPLRPGWLVTGWALLVGYVWAALLLALPALVLFWLGLIDHNAGPRRPPGLVVAPYYPGGAWAVVTDLAVGAVVIAVTGLAIHGSVLRRTGYAVPRRVVLAALAVTGWAPYLGFHALALSGGAAFVSTLVLLRWKAAPTAKSEPEPWPVKQLALLIAITAVLVLGYATFHPLRTTGLGVFSDSNGRNGMIMEVRNSGFASVKIVGVDTPATTEAFPLFRRRLVETVIRPHTKLTIFLRATCPPTVVHLRYRLLGRAWTEPLLLPMACSD